MSRRRVFATPQEESIGDGSVSTLWQNIADDNAGWQHPYVQSGLIGLWDGQKRLRAGSGTAWDFAPQGTIAMVDTGQGYYVMPNKNSSNYAQAHHAQMSFTSATIECVIGGINRTAPCCYRNGVFCNSAASISAQSPPSLYPYAHTNWMAGMVFNPHGLSSDGSNLDLAHLHYTIINDSALPTYPRLTSIIRVYENQKIELMGFCDPSHQLTHGVYQNSTTFAVATTLSDRCYITLKSGYTDVFSIASALQYMTVGDNGDANNCPYFISIRVYNRALTDAEVFANAIVDYNRFGEGGSSPLI